MIQELLPDTVVAEETHHDLPDISLFPEEQATLRQAVTKRRREFMTARACARRAFARLGLPAQPVTNGPRGEPRWPSGLVGSITHCDRYRACALARASDISTVGIDAEPENALPDGVLVDIARPEELIRLRDLTQIRPEVHWDRLLFSAKEAVYKAWFPLAKRWLGFEDAIVSIDPSDRTFSARLSVPGPVLGRQRLTQFPGRWLVQDGLVLTAIAYPRVESPTGFPDETEYDDGHYDDAPSRIR